MQKEIIARGATVEIAKESAIAQLGVDSSLCKFEILEQPKKSLFGKLKGEAVVKATSTIIEPIEFKAQPIATSSAINATGTSPTTMISEIAGANEKLRVAMEYLKNILTAMGLKDVSLSVQEKKDGAVISFGGDGIAVLIGHHGETLDSLQYLIALTCNRVDGDYYRISLDCGNYREKREATLEGLAKRISEKVKRTGRSQFLEPMNPYERRIIHAVVSDIEGVTSKSRGDEPNRRVVIMSTSSSAERTDRAERPLRANTNTPRTSPAATSANSGDRPRRNTNEPRTNDSRDKEEYRPLKPLKQERSMEEILKKDIKRGTPEQYIQYDPVDKEEFKKKEQDAELFSKYEF